MFRSYVVYAQGSGGSGNGKESNNGKKTAGVDSSGTATKKKVVRPSGKKTAGNAST